MSYHLTMGRVLSTTPYLNRQRKEAFDAEMKACKEAAAKSGMTQINSVTQSERDDCAAVAGNSALTMAALS